ncbi:MAG: Asp-tRNA(Asn)/Glu-tRNA(Gln) amidotransferase subunit GatC [Firmicutes bacterium]|nr:Asp-tRNA(Asn)/Glu-tRNA(Gln) amidotransferase subunit GatC [Bacillota bacterium]HXL03300.1 Asp-tRNA(Asn)/Glu-tRNA(Gln) amidotransferase subunit GatC [Bacillota bacterium]
MRITKEDVGRISILARLKLSEDDQSLFAEQLSGILQVIDSLDEVDTGDMNRMISPAGLTNVFREDVVLPSIDPEEALKNAPDKEGAFFKVPRILEAD